MTPTLLGLERSILHPPCMAYGMSEKFFFAIFALRGIERLTYLDILLKFKKKILRHWRVNVFNYYIVRILRRFFFRFLCMLNISQQFNT